MQTWYTLFLTLRNFAENNQILTENNQIVVENREILPKIKKFLVRHVLKNVIFQHSLKIAAKKFG